MSDRASQKEAAEPWIDAAYSSKYRTVYTEKEMGIPGLRMFGKHTRNQAGDPLRTHFHPNAYEFTFVTEGTLSFTIDGQEYEVSGYDMIMTRPDEVHSTNFLPQPVGEIIWFQLDVSVTERFLFMDVMSRQDFLDGLARIPGPAIHPGSSQSFELIKKAFELAGDPRQRYLTASCLTLLLHGLMALSGKELRSVSPDMELVLSYIKEHLSSPLALEELAGLCRLSVSQLKQKFKAQVGIAPRHYINYKKIQAAKRLLAEGRPVTETAMELGFESSSYFTVVFKRYNACTPTEYLKNQRSAAQSAAPPQRPPFLP